MPCRLHARICFNWIVWGVAGAIDNLDSWGDMFFPERFSLPVRRDASVVRMHNFFEEGLAIG
jgi:hypothetical protein